MLICNIIDRWLFESHGMFSVSNVLGKEGQGVYILMSRLDIERTLGSAGPLGWASFWIFNLDIYMLCLVSARNVLDKENKGVYVLMSGLDIERVFASSGCVGWELIYDQFTVIVNWRYYPVFIFQLGQNSMDAHEKILWFWSESFNFTSRHEQESPVYDHVFNDLPLYVHVPLYLEKNPASTSLMLLAFEFP